MSQLLLKIGGKRALSEQQFQEMPSTTFFPPAQISIALGKIPAVFALFTSVISLKGIVFWIKTHQTCQETVKNEKRNHERQRPQ